MEVTGKDGATETGVDTNYVADVIAAQGTWDAWPTPAAQDTPMPAKDAPTTPHDDPAPAQDD